MKNPRLIILFFTMVVVMIGFGIIIPIIPFYVEQYGASGSALGMLMAVFSIMQFIFAPMWGSLSDRIGRKRVLMIGVAGNAISHLIFGLANGLPLMFLSRAMAGVLSSATFPSALAYISDNTDERNRGGGMGIIGAAMGIGMVLGPGIGGWLGAGSLSTPFFVASGMSVLALVLILLILPESRPVDPQAANAPGQAPVQPQRTSRLRAMGQALFGPIGFFFFLAFLINFALANFEGIFGLYAANRYHYGPQQVGSILTVIGLVTATIQLLVTGPATRRLGEETVIKLSLAASAFGFVLMLFARQYSMVLLTVGFFVFSNAMLRPSIAASISKRAETGQGMAMGLSSGFESLGRVVGPLWAGFMFDQNLLLPYSSAAVIMLIGFVLTMVIMRPGRQPAQSTFKIPAD